MRRIHGMFVVLSLIACAPGGGSTATQGSTGGTTGATGTTGETTGGPTTSAGGSMSSGAASGTGSATSTGLVTSTGEVSTGGTTGGSSSTGSGETGEPVGCVTDKDCALTSDCCTCEGFLLADGFVPCDEDCDVPLCVKLGIFAVECRLGACVPKRLSCDASKVTCEIEEPLCPDGTVAETEGDCWTGRCVPPNVCDVVPDCSLCPKDMLCVSKVGWMVDEGPRCDPVPPACAEVDCGCVGSLVCTEPYTGCDAAGSAITCTCPAC